MKKKQQIRKLSRRERLARFRRELAKLNPKEEKKIAKEFGDGGLKWPKY